MSPFAHRGVSRTELNGYESLKQSLLFVDYCKTYPYSFGDKLTEEGRYFITVEDAYGNKNSFVIVIDKTVGVDVNVCNGGITNEGVTISPNEKVTVAVTKDGKQYGYSAGEAITEEGFIPQPSRMPMAIPRPFPSLS